LEVFSMSSKDRSQHDAAQAPPTSILEAYARQVTADVYPDETAQAPVGAASDTTPAPAAAIMDTIATIIAIFTKIMQACPAPPSQVAQSLRNPNVRQRAALKLECMNNAGGFRLRKSNEIYQSMIARRDGGRRQGPRGRGPHAVEPAHLI
jgi:hypothetical protein